MKKRRSTTETFGVAKTVIWAILLALLLRTFTYEPFNIPSASMIPTLLVGDSVLVSKFSYGYSRYSFPIWYPPFEGRIFGRLPALGDVAVFRLPTDLEKNYIKRIVGLPGDKIQVIDGVLQINGEPVRRDRIGDFLVTAAGVNIRIRQFLETLPNGVSHPILQPVDNGALDQTPVYEVPPGHVFAMGDNRDNSRDSRAMDEVGFIPLENLVGRAELRFFSLDPHAAWWEFWRWGTTIRGDRLFTAVH
jgi:signal peptidase I